MSDTGQPALRVLFLTHRLPFAPNRGDRIRAYHMLRHLSAHATVDLVSLVHDNEEARAIASVPAHRVTVVPVTPWRNRVRAGFSLPGSRPLTHILLDAPNLVGTIADVCRANRPDVVLAFCSGMARLAMAAPLKDIPLVVDMVDVDSAKWRALSGSAAVPIAWVYGREARCLERFEVDLVSAARTTLVVNDREHRTLAQLCPTADIRTVPNGIDLDHFRPTSQSAASQARVVFCGVMNYEPNEEAAMRLIRHVWPLVRMQRPDAQLTIVGAYPSARLREAARLDATVEVTGAVPDVRPYLWQSGVSAAPLKTARGLQNKVLEALAADLPVVTTPAVAEGLPTAVLPGCVIADSEAASAEAIVSLLGLTEPERRSFARRADLSDLGWARQLSPIVPILTAAARGKSVRRLAS